jgi:hypothetical protein
MKEADEGNMKIGKLIRCTTASGTGVGAKLAVGQLHVGAHEVGTDSASKMATSTFLCYLIVLELAVVSGHVALVVAQPPQSSMRECVKGRSEPPSPVKKKKQPH